MNKEPLSTLSHQAIKTSKTVSFPHIAYDDCGLGHPIIFLHGVGGNRTNWRDQLNVVGREYRVIAWDLRGYGLSSDYEGAASFELFSDDLLRLYDHLGVEKAVVVGLSMGGRILQHFYHAHCERVTAAVLCDTLERPKADLDPAFRAKFLAARKAPLLSGKTPAQIAPDLAKSLCSERCSPEHFARLVESLAALRTESYIKTLDAVAKHDEIARLPEFKCPVCLIYGAEDRLTTPTMGLELAGRISGAEFHVIDGAGHLSNIERPEAFNDVLLNFIRRHVPALGDDANN